MEWREEEVEESDGELEESAEERAREREKSPDGGRALRRRPYTHRDRPPEHKTNPIHFPRTRRPPFEDLETQRERTQRQREKSSSTFPTFDSSSPPSLSPRPETRAAPSFFRSFRLSVTPRKIIHRHTHRDFDAAARSRHAKQRERERAKTEI